MWSRLRLSTQHARKLGVPFFRKAERGHVFSVFCAAVLSIILGWPNPLPAVENMPPTMDGDMSMGSGHGLKILTKKTVLPLFVFGDQSGRLSHFVPSGYMGDVNSLSSLTSTYDASAPASVGRSGHTSMKIQYSGKGKQGWAGIYWLSPANNWGTTKGAGFDLRKAKKLTFWVRGDQGGEKISQFKVGGVNGPYPDSDSGAIGPITLTKDWQQMTIDLSKKDLRHIVGGFMFLVRRGDNQKGATFYLDEIVFRGNPEDEVEFPVAKDEEQEEAQPQAALTGSNAPVAPVKEASGSTGSPFAAQGLKLGTATGARAGEEEKARAKNVVVAAPAPAPKVSWREAEPIPVPGPWLKYRKSSTNAK